MTQLSVVAGVLRGDGPREVLAFRRSPGRHAGGLWEFPGGKVEAGESDEQALARELVEELGLSVRVREQLFSAETEDLAIRFYRCERLGGHLTLTDHDAVQSVVREQLQGLDWALGDIDFVNYLRELSSPSWPFG